MISNISQFPISMVYLEQSPEAQAIPPRKKKAQTQ